MVDRVAVVKVAVKVAVVGRARGASYYLVIDSRAVDGFVLGHRNGFFFAFSQAVRGAAAEWWCRVLRSSELLKFVPVPPSRANQTCWLGVASSGYKRRVFYVSAHTNSERRALLQASSRLHPRTEVARRSRSAAVTATENHTLNDTAGCRLRALHVLCCSCLASPRPCVRPRKRGR